MIDALSPYGVSCACGKAASGSSNASMTSSGPNVSSAPVVQIASAGTSVRMVGCVEPPFGVPPVTSVAPRSRASCTRARDLLDRVVVDQRADDDLRVGRVARS